MRMGTCWDCKLASVMLATFSILGLSGRNFPEKMRVAYMTCRCIHCSVCPVQFYPIVHAMSGIYINVIPKSCFPVYMLHVIHNCLGSLPPCKYQIIAARPQPGVRRNTGVRHIGYLVFALLHLWTCSLGALGLED